MKQFFSLMITISLIYPCKSMSLFLPRKSSWRTGENSRQSANNNETVRRQFLLSLIGMEALCVSFPRQASAKSVAETTIYTTPTRIGPNVVRVRDPNTYEALVYTPPNKPAENERIPLLLVLHGAGSNDQSALALADTNGEHAGLAPSLLASRQAPKALADNFCVLAPYVGDGKRSFYEEPRSKLLAFLNWALSKEGQAAGCPTQNVDPNRICLFGFSDGATVAVELATTQRFQAVVVAAYGFTGTLPKLALQRLANVPMWVFHSQDDVIFPVRSSDQLVQSLRTVSTLDKSIRYNRYEHDPEGCTGSIQGHCVGITASKTNEIYEWMLDVSSA